MKRKFSLFVSLLVIATVVLSACTAAATPAPTEETGAQPTAPEQQPTTAVVQPTAAEAQPTAAEAQPTAAGQAGEFDWKKYAGTEITLLFNEHPWTEGVRPHIQEFEDLTGITVDLQPFAEDLYFDRMYLAARSEQPVADVFFLPMDFNAFTMFSANQLAPLTPYIDDPTMTMPDYDLEDFPEGFRAAALFPAGDPSAQLYGIPITFEAYILFYNKDLVDQYLDGKVPTTFQELIDSANTISQEGNGEVYGAVMRGVRSDTIIDTLTGVVFNSWGTDPTPLPYNLWFDGAWDQPRFTDPRIQEGLSNYAALMKAGPPNIQAIDWYDANQLFAQGKVAFFIDASLFGPGYENPETSTVAGKVGYMPMPPTEQGAMTGHWMWGLGIPANSANKEAAWYFIQWATSKEMEPQIGTLTGGAPRLSTWANSQYSEALNPEYVTAVQTAMETSRPTAVFNEKWKEVVIMVVDALHEIYAGTPPEEATQNLQQKALGVMTE